MASAMDLTTDLIFSDSQGVGERARERERGRGRQGVRETRKGGRRERPDFGQRGEERWQDVRP